MLSLSHVIVQCDGGILICKEMEWLTLIIKLNQVTELFIQNDPTYKNYGFSLYINVEKGDHQDGGGKYWGVDVAVDMKDSF